MKKIKPIEEWFLWKLCEVVMRYILIVSSVILIAVVGIAVFMRYVMNGDFFGSDELICVFAMWVYWIGGAYGSYECSHITADMTNLFIKNEKTLRIVQIFVNALNVIITGIFAYWGIVNYALWNIQSGKTTPGLGIPLLASNLPISIAFVLMFLYSLYHFIRLFVVRKDTVTTDAALEEGGNE